MPGPRRSLPTANPAAIAPVHPPAATVASSPRGTTPDAPRGFVGGDAYASNLKKPGGFHPSKLHPFIWKYFFPTSYPHKSQAEALRVQKRVVQLRRWGPPALAFMLLVFPYESLVGRDRSVLEGLETDFEIDDGED